MCTFNFFFADVPFFLFLFADMHRSPIFSIFSLGSVFSRRPVFSGVRVLSWSDETWTRLALLGLGRDGLGYGGLGGCQAKLS